TRTSTRGTRSSSAPTRSRAFRRRDGNLSGSSRIQQATRRSSRRPVVSDSSSPASVSSLSKGSKRGSTRSIRSGGMEDEAVVARQLGRPPRAFRRVAVRCPYGRPAVTEQWPRDAAGAPFPTTYYLTCRWLVAAISRLEAGGGVERWTEAVRSEPVLAASLERASGEQRRLRRELAAPGWEHASLDSGIGGSSRDGSPKCLHAHAAFALARPGYELGARAVREPEPLWPERCCPAPCAPPSCCPRPPSTR